MGFSKCHRPGSLAAEPKMGVPVEGLYWGVFSGEPAEKCRAGEEGDITEQACGFSWIEASALSYSEFWNVNCIRVNPALRKGAAPCTPIVFINFSRGCVTSWGGGGWGSRHSQQLGECTGRSGQDPAASLREVLCCFLRLHKNIYITERYVARPCYFMLFRCSLGRSKRRFELAPN